MTRMLQTIYIIWLRELKLFYRTKSRIIGIIAMPFFFLLFFGNGFGPGFSYQEGAVDVTYLNFLVPGILGMAILFSSTYAGFSVLWDKEFGFLKEIMVTPVRRSAIVIGRIAGGVTTSMIQGILILIMSFILGFSLENILLIIPAIILLTLISAGFIGVGVIFSSLMNDVHGFSIVVNFFIFPIFLLSGTFFPISNLPAWLKPLAYIDPLTYGIDGLRGILLGVSEFNLGLDILIVIGFAALTVFIGTWLFRKSEV